jgi:hypothetical protein
LQMMHRPSWRRRCWRRSWRLIVDLRPAFFLIVSVLLRRARLPKSAGPSPGQTHHPPRCGFGLGDRRVVWFGRGFPGGPAARILRPRYLRPSTRSFTLESATPFVPAAHRPQHDIGGIDSQQGGSKRRIGRGRRHGPGVAGGSAPGRPGLRADSSLQYSTVNQAGGGEEGRVGMFPRQCAAGLGTPGSRVERARAPVACGSGLRAQAPGAGDVGLS